MKKKGQSAIIGLLFAFVLVAVFAVILSPFLEFIDIGINATLTSGPTHSTAMVAIINAMPLFLCLVILVAIVALITGSR